MFKFSSPHSFKIVKKSGNVPSSATVSKETRRMNKLGKIDGMIGADNVGYIIDQHNQVLEKAKEKDYNNEITAMNKYYWKLWMRVSEETGH